MSDLVSVWSTGDRFVSKVYSGRDRARRMKGCGSCLPMRREVSDAAQVSDQGQISKLLARLEGVGLLQNTGGDAQGLPNAWHLTPQGEETLRAGTHQSRGKDGRPGYPGMAR
jgi:hypothetical protein